MNTKITDDLIQEATELLERWAEKRNLLPKGKKLFVTMSIEDSTSVSLKMKDKPSSTELDELLSQSIEELELSERAKTCIGNSHDIYLIGDLTRKTERELLSLRNFGKKSYEEVREKLQQRGLTLAMNIPVGPREREVVLRCSFYPYVSRKAIGPLESAGIMFVKDLLSKTEDEIISLLKDCDPDEIGSPKRVYHQMRESLVRRGLI